MSREEVEVVRQPITLNASSRRRLRERLFLRFPGVATALSRVVLSFPPRSRLRQAMIRDAFRLAIEAANRGDYEAAFCLLPSDYETITPPELVGIGFDPVYRGRDGRLRYQHEWVAQLGDFRQQPEEVIDLGDRVMLLGRMTGIGRGSGAAFDSELAYLITLSGGRMIREHEFRSHREALEAASLSR